MNLDMKRTFLATAGALALCGLIPASADATWAHVGQPVAGSGPPLKRSGWRRARAGGGLIFRQAGERRPGRYSDANALAITPSWPLWTTAS